MFCGRMKEFIGTITRRNGAMENVAQKPGDFLFFLLLFGWVFFFRSGAEKTVLKVYRKERYECNVVGINLVSFSC